MQTLNTPADVDIMEEIGNQSIDELDVHADLNDLPDSHTRKKKSSSIQVQDQ